MDERASKALEGSIQKWQAIVDGTDVDLGWRNCPLCTEYFDQSNSKQKNCAGCPISALTGKTNCVGTPYTKLTILNKARAAYSEMDVQGAREELQYLQSVRAALKALD